MPCHVVHDSLVIDLNPFLHKSAKRFMEHYGRTGAAAFKDLEVLDEETAHKMLKKFEDAYPGLARLTQEIAMNFQTLKDREPYIWYCDIDKDPSWVLRWQDRDYLDEPLMAETEAEARQEAAERLGISDHRVGVEGMGRST
jgi:hypothetical protein